MSETKFLTYQSSLPGFSPRGRSFSQIYKTLVKEHYVGVSSAIQKKFLGKADGLRTCCFCDKTEPAVTFLKVSHAIPAFLGNRIFFSLEECDICNEQFGQDCEDQLARWTEPERILFQLPTREGPPKSTIKGASAQFDLVNGVLQMSMGNENDFAQIDVDKDAKEVKIEMDAKDFIPSKAIRSILRTAWMFLTPDQRKSQKEIKNLILGKAILEPFQFTTCHVPDSPGQGVSFCIYEKINKSEALPDMLIELAVSHLKILWATPDWKTLKSLPFPLPSIKSRADAPAPSATQNQIDGWNDVSKRPKATFVFKFDKIEPGVPASNTSKAPPKLIKGSSAVKLLIKNDTDKALLNGLYQKILNANTSSPVLNFSSQGAVSFSLSPKPNANVDFSYHFRPHSKSLLKLKEALNFLKILHSGKSELKVLSPLGEEKYAFTSNAPKISSDYTAEENTLKFLEILNSYYGVFPTFPKNFLSEKETNLMSEICSILQEEITEDLHGVMTGILSDFSADAVEKIKQGPFEVVETKSQQSIFLLGNNIDVPAHTKCWQECKFIQIDTVDDLIKIKVSFSSIKYEIIGLS